MRISNARPPQEKLEQQSKFGLNRWPQHFTVANWLWPLALVLICAVFFYPIVFGSRAFPWDFVAWNYPMQRYVGESLRAGEWPLWNPRVMLGYPMMGDPQANIYNPLFLLYHLLPGVPLIQPNTLAKLEVAYIALAGVSMFYLARHFRLTRRASFLAGLVYMLAGFIPIHVEHMAWVIATAWVPLLLLLASRLMQRFQLRVFLALGLVTALSVFAGYPQTTLWSVYLVAAYFAWWALPHLLQRKPRPVVVASLALAGSFAIGIGLAAVQLVPILEFTEQTTRGAQNYAGQSLGGLSPGAWLTLLLPKVFGSDGRFAYLAGEVTHTQKYLGLLPLVLVPLAALLAWRRARPGQIGRDARFFLGLAVIGLWGSYGARLYLYRVIELLPLVTLFRRAATLFPFALLGIAMLSALAFDDLLKMPASPASVSGAVPGRGRRPQFAVGPYQLGLLVVLLLLSLYALGSAWPTGLQQVLSLGESQALQAIAADDFASTLRWYSLEMLLFAGVLGLLFGGLRLSRWRPVFAGALLVFAVLDLYRFNARQIFSVTASNPYAFVASLPPLSAVEPPSLGADRVAVDVYVGPPNFALYAGGEELGGYNPLQLSRTIEFISAVSSVNARSFDLLNVRYLYLHRYYHEAGPGPGPDPATFAAITRGDGTKVYLPEETLDPQKFVLRGKSFHDWFELWENQEVLPRFFAANQYRVLPVPADRLAFLSQTDFDPSQTIVLEQTVSVPLGGRLQAPARIIAYARNFFELEVNVVDGSTLLFMSVPYYPGWQATVDGQPAPVLAADHAFMALVLAPGTHIVRMAFQPRSFYVGLALSSLTAALCLGLGLTRVLRLRQRWTYGPDD